MCSLYSLEVIGRIINMKGIILAAGKGTRLYPVTKAISKPLLPIYDKPMIYYPLSVLMLADIKEILLIVSEDDINDYKRLLGDGSSLGINISYEIQYVQKGIADAFIVAEEFIGSDSVALILGDNLFYGYSLKETINNAKENKNGATIFGYPVVDPRAFGVVEFDEEKRVVSLEEKPQNPRSKYAVPGLYFYDNDVIEIAKNLKPSKRGELEITDVNIEYLKRNNLKVETFEAGIAWLDTGTHKGLLEAAVYVESVQSMQGVLVSSIEEIAYRQGFINSSELRVIAEPMSKTDYGQYLLNIV